MRNSNMTSAVTGLTLAAIAGTTAYMMSTGSSRRARAQTKRLRRTAGKALKNAEHIMEGVAQILQ